MKNLKLQSAVKIAAALIFAQLAGAIGALFTTPQTGVGTWYSVLDKPSFNPPSWVFGPVWTTLFLLMGYASYLIWETKKSTIRKWAIALYIVQLVLNTLWSVLFFGLHSPGVAVIEIVFLEAAIIACTVLFYKIKPLAAYLMLPYILWVAFASFLNFTIWLIN